MKLFLIRHGDTEMNSAARFWGATDVKLSPAGIRQAERLRDRLSGEEIDTVYSSGLSRAVVTAGCIASPRGLTPVIVPEMNEIDFGRFEGLTYGEIIKLDPTMDDLLVRWSTKRSFPGGESLAQLDERVSRFVARLNASAEGTRCVITHAGPLRLLICNLLGIGLEHSRKLRLSLASLSIVEVYRGGAVLSLLNDTSHLAESGCLGRETRGSQEPPSLTG
ncbi:MAG: histidine phosphatase family protein [Chloroflexi bacterium]|nr:histidine phosphatase family protein [Chloroflexota bacterium]